MEDKHEELTPLCDTVSSRRLLGSTLDTLSTHAQYNYNRQYRLD